MYKVSSLCVKVLLLFCYCCCCCCCCCFCYNLKTSGPSQIMNVGTAQAGDGGAPPCRPPPSTVMPGPDSGAFCKRKKKRVRTVYSGWQLAALEAQFRVQQYLVGEQRVRFAEQLELNQTQVKVWFQNRRIRFRRDQWATKVQKDTVVNASTATERTGTKQFE